MKKYEYKGVVWHSYAELSRKLGMCDSYVCRVLSRNPNWTVEDVIDYSLGFKKKYIRKKGDVKEYRGYAWITMSDLSRALGKGDSYVANRIWLEPNLTEYDIIDSYLSKIKEYRGITWTSNAELCRKLNLSRNTYCIYKSRTPDMTEEDFIDLMLASPIKKRQNSGSYRGYSWKSYSDLGRQLGRSAMYVSQLLLKHPELTVEDIIDRSYEPERNVDKFRGITYSTQLELSKKLGKSSSYVCTMLRKHPTWSSRDVINYVLDGCKSEE